MADKNLGSVNSDQTILPQHYEDQGDGSFAPRVSPVVQTALAPNDFDPPIVPAGWSSAPRVDDRSVAYSRSSWRDVAAAAYATILDNIGLGNLQLVLPLWELGGGPYRSLVNRDKSFTAWGVVTPGQPGTLHQIVQLDGSSGFIQEDPIVFNYTPNTYDTSMSGGTFMAAQQFIPSVTAPVGFVRAQMRKVGAPGGNVKMAIFSDSAGSPSTVITNGTSNVVALSGITSPGYVGFAFATAPSLVAGTTYWLLLEYDTPSAIDGSDLIEWEYDIVGAFGLPRATFNGSVWTVTTGQSFAFDVYDNVLALGTNASWTLIIGAQWLGGLGVFGYLVNMGGPIGANPIFYLRRSNGNQMSTAVLESGGVNDTVTVNVAPTDYSIWAITFSYTAASNKVQLYRNGVLLGSHNGTATTAPPLQVQPLTFGMQQGDFGVGAPASISNSWNGTVGPCILTNTLMTPTQISQVTNQLLALRRFQEAI